MNLDVAMKIDPPVWMRDEATQKLMKALGADQGAALFVGGCVRNQIFKKSVEDIDIATSYKPDVVVDRLNQANIKSIPTGLAHGTITAVIEGRSFEITTLRHDVKTDGRHAEVQFTESWIEDAKRRDFTMNTLLCDLQGHVYDPLGCGLEDLQKRRVVFVGDPDERIAEDYLRILRFFRFHAYYGEGEMDEAALKACRDAADKISTLSRERITSEFLKILSSDTASEVLQIMLENNILRDVVGSDFNQYDLEVIKALQIEHDTINVMSRLYVLNGFQPKFHDEYLRLTHKQKNFLVKLVMATRPEIFMNEKSLKKAIFHHGNDLMLQGYLVWLTKESGQADPALLDVLKNWIVPECPVTGEQLIAEGYVTGSDLGQELERRKQEWLDSVI